MKRTLLLTTLALLLIVPAASAAHSVTITNKGDATPGSYTINVDVDKFQLVPVTGGDGEKGKGHIHYLLNGQPAPGNYATTETSFTYTNLKEGDVVSVELVLDNHQPSGTDSNGNLNGQSVKDSVTISSAQNAPGFEAVAVIAIMGAIVAMARRK